MTLADNNLLLTLDHRQGCYTFSEQAVLGDLSEQSSSTLLSISANHQLLRESGLLQTPTQAKDISKPAHICVWRTSGAERKVSALFEMHCPGPLVVSAHHRIYRLMVWSMTALELPYRLVHAYKREVLPLIKGQDAVVEQGEGRSVIMVIKGQVHCGLLYCMNIFSDLGQLPNTVDHYPT